MNKTLAVCLCWLASTVAYSATVNMLSCCPGEDTATQARFVWHSDSNACTFWYAKASAPGSAVQVPCESVYKPITFRDKGDSFSYYKYTTELSGLVPGTEYIYYVKSGSDQSATQKFKTAGTSGSYNFLWMSDVHAHPDNPGKITNVNKLYSDAVSKTSASGGIDFIFFTGDYAKYGSRYDNWQQWNGSPTMTDNMFALLVGNHEYYYTGAKVSDVPNRDESKMWHNNWILACRNDPKNGAMGASERLETSYWFIRDSVLFICIDSLVDYSLYMSDDLYANAVSYQKTWFRNVVQSQAGKFRYIIAAQHDPWMKKSSTSSISKSDYSKWYSVFDEFKVDLALSSDDHVYHRSNPLRGDVKQSSTADGTIYMVSPTIDEKDYSTSLITSFSGDAAKYLYTASESGAYGACWIEVRPSGLKVTYFWDDVDGSYSKKDEFTILPKDRGSEYEYSPPVAAVGFDGQPHGRYRFAVDAPRSDTLCMQLSEIQLFDASGNTIRSSAFTLDYDSSTKGSYEETYPSNESPDNAVDGDLGTKWLDWRAGLSQSAEVRSAVWLDFCFASPTVVTGYRWYTGDDDSTYTGRTPVSWTFSASDDGGATWSVIDRVAGYDTTTENNALAYSKRTVVPDSSTTAGGTYYALAVGVNKYSRWPNGENDLGGCVADAEDVLSACTNAAKGIWTAANCYSLYDNGATLSAARSRFQSLADVAQSGDTVLYYQSSHGGNDKSDPFRAHLCMTDADYYDDVFASDLLRFKTGVRIVVIIDACHSGGMFKGEEAPEWNFAASVQARMDEIKEEMRTKGVKASNSPSVGWITACDYDQLSVEVNGRGWFTKPFVTAWKADATDANHDGYNDFLEIFDIAAPQATNSARQPQKLNDDLLASVAAWEIYQHIPDSYVWTGNGGDGNFSNPANWDGGEVPVSGCVLNFAGLSTNATINVDVQDAVFSTLVMGGKVVTFTGSITASAITDTSKVAVGANSTVTLDGDLVFANPTNGNTDYIINKVNSGGAFVVTGRIESGAEGKGYVVPSVDAGEGMIVASGLVQNSSCSDNPSFRLVRDAAGTTRWIIGADGISGTKNYWLLNNGGRPTAIIKPDNSDFAVSAKIGNRLVATLRFDTTGRDGMAHTITVNADGGIYREGNVYIEGSGTVVCAYEQTDSSNQFIVTNTATLALNAGSNIGDGVVTVNGGATLALRGAGTATIGGALSLAAGSTVRFNGLGAGVASLMVGSLSVAVVSGENRPTISVDCTGLAAGLYTLVESSAEFSADAESFALQTMGIASGQEAYLVKRESDNSICLRVKNHCVWTGNGGDGDMSNPANWEGEVVPSADNASDISEFDLSEATSLTGDLVVADDTMLVLPEAGTGPVHLTGGFAAGAGDGETVTVRLGDGSVVANGCYVLLDASSVSGLQNLTFANGTESGAGAVFKTYGDGRLALFVGIEPPSEWVNESAETQCLTGDWATPIEYDADGKAHIDEDNMFVPLTASTGKVVTIETKAQFCEYSRNDTPDLKDVQAAVRISTNGYFQVWTNEWIDVVAEGLKPVSGEEYTLRATLNYTSWTYEVEVKTESTEFARLGERGNTDKTVFPLAFSNNCVSGIGFIGDTYFTSLSGDCRYEIIGFAKDEALALSNNVERVLSAAEAEWLNKCAGGDKSAVKLKAAGLTEQEFTDACLLNVDVTGDRSYTFKVTSVNVTPSNVIIGIELTRPGKLEQAINGTLKFYGAATLEAFKSAALPLVSAELSNDDFSTGDSVTATISLDGENPPAFFKAKIEKRGDE